MKLAKHVENKFRSLAEQGFGDDTIFDPAGNLWVVFRLPSFDIFVESVSNKYKSVKAVAK